MKTVEQIVDGELVANTEGVFEVLEMLHPDARNKIIRAMESIATEAQKRPEIDQDWRDDQENVRDADHVEVEWKVRDESGRNLFASNMTLTAEQAVGMFQGIGEAAA